MNRRVEPRAIVQRGELALIAAAAALVSAVSIHFDAFGHLADYVERYASWELDQLFVVALFGGLASLVLLFRRARDLRAEIGRRKASERKVTKLARHDPLTGLPNRRVLGEEIEAALAKVKAGGSECAVFLIDLDRFQPVNDAHGHAVGDALLIEVANRIAVTVDIWGTVARMGSDEFACVISYEPGDDRPARLAAQISRSLSDPILLGGLSLDMRATIGMARAPQDGTTREELLHGADLAMYDGKRQGGGACHFFDEEMGLAVRERTALEADLRQATIAGDIIPYFQPIMNLRQGGIIGFEALARWPHPTRGLVLPDTFIPIAEDLGIIDEITYSMLRASCIAARDWPAALWLSVNVSPVQLKDAWLAARLLAILTETGFPPSRLIVEVTENAVIEDMIKAQDVFTSLQNVGVRIALDDFGKGYSSLHHLRQLHFDHLKIDRSFVHSMDSWESAKIVSALAGLGKSLGMPVTAEGVETREEAAALRELGCEQAQGYLFGRPINAAGTNALLYERAGSALAQTRAA